MKIPGQIFMLPRTPCSAITSNWRKEAPPETTKGKRGAEEAYENRQRPHDLPDEFRHPGKLPRNR